MRTRISTAPGGNRVLELDQGSRFTAEKLILRIDQNLRSTSFDPIQQLSPPPATVQHRRQEIATNTAGVAFGSAMRSVVLQCP
ncbi:hypothetical protein V6N13_054694 [Hibiscus sabdariffa]